MDGDREEPPTAEAEDTIRMTSLGDVALADGALVLTANSRERAERGGTYWRLVWAISWGAR